jgi:hypothetical protein
MIYIVVSVALSRQMSRSWRVMMNLSQCEKVQVVRQELSNFNRLVKSLSMGSYGPKTVTT